MRRLGGKRREVESGSREKRETEETRTDGSWGAEGGVPPGRGEGSSRSWLPPWCSRAGLLKERRMSLYLCRAGQESSADVIKILSSSVKGTYRSSSAKLSFFFFEKENQLNRWGLSFQASRERDQGCLLTAPKLMWSSESTPRMAGEGP